MRQKTFIKQTSLAILLYFICLALAVAIDLIFFKVKNMYHTPALAAIFAGWVYLGLIRKTKQFGAITCLGIFMSIFFRKSATKPAKKLGRKARTKCPEAKKKMDIKIPRQ